MIFSANLSDKQILFVRSPGTKIAIDVVVDVAIDLIFSNYGL